MSKSIKAEELQNLINERDKLIFRSLFDHENFTKEMKQQLERKNEIICSEQLETGTLLSREKEQERIKTVMFALNKENSQKERTKETDNNFISFGDSRKERLERIQTINQTEKRRERLIESIGGGVLERVTNMSELASNEVKALEQSDTISEDSLNEKLEQLTRIIEIESSNRQAQIQNQQGGNAFVNNSAVSNRSSVNNFTAPLSVSRPIIAQ